LGIQNCEKFRLKSFVAKKVTKKFDLEKIFSAKTKLGKKIIRAQKWA